MAIFSDHPYTSITIKIEQLSKPRNDEIDNTIELYVSDLLHLIKIQPSTGSSEAARAIRKRIKYGNSVQEQLRALTLLELLILNAGQKIGPVIACDDKLVDVLRGIVAGSAITGNGTNYDKQVIQKCRALAIGWKSELHELNGYKYLANLWKSLPSKGHSRSRSKSKSVQEYDAFSDLGNVRSPSPSSPAVRRGVEPGTSSRNMDRAAKAVPPPRPSTKTKPSTSTKANKSSTRRRRKNKHGIVYADEQYRIPQINYKVEAPKIRNTIAECHTHTTALTNLLISLPSHVLPMDDSNVTKEFEKCKSIRRKVLSYLQFVGAGDNSEKKPEVIQMDEEFLGSLITANEQLITAFKKYDLLAGYTEANPAPDYDDESSGESYYTDESSEEEDLEEETGPAPGPDRDSASRTTYDDEIDLVASRLDSQLGPAPPRPSAPPSAPSAQAPPLMRLETNNTVATAGTGASDPFGDGHELGPSRFD